MMRFEKATESEAAERISTILEEHLKKGSVLWLVPGGSALRVAVGALRDLNTKEAPSNNLAITLTDERYGPVGHNESNWQQLEEAGLNVPGATLHPVLHGASIEETARAWSGWLMNALDEADYSVGFFGIGPDGHTSGILPHSAAVEAPGLVAAYDGGAYQRITTTGETLARLDEAIVYAAGEAKHSVLDELTKDVPVEDQPAQYLKRIPKVTIFNDYKEN